MANRYCFITFPLEKLLFIFVMDGRLSIVFSASMSSTEDDDESILKLSFLFFALLLR